MSLTYTLYLLNPEIYFANFQTCVDFPHPSIPSKTINMIKINILLLKRFGKSKKSNFINYISLYHKNILKNSFRIFGNFIFKNIYTQEYKVL